jgi:AraC-like DNA-binding protein
MRSPPLFGNNIPSRKQLKYIDPEIYNKYITKINLDCIKEYINKNKKFNTIPFIIITANMDDEMKYKQLENGINDYIMKPFKPKELILKIRNLLNFRNNIEKKYKSDPFSNMSIKLSKKDFLASLNDFLLKNIKSKIDIEELSKELFISRSTLDKRIRKLSNKNVSQYIREFKLEYAIRLIDLGEKNIQFLVDETGFNSFSYFSTSFKSYVGLTTRDYIKSIQKNSI